MVKISVDLVFPNEARYQDFIEGAEALGMSPVEYLLELVERNVPTVEVASGSTDMEGLDG